MRRLSESSQRTKADAANVTDAGCALSCRKAGCRASPNASVPANACRGIIRCLIGWCSACWRSNPGHGPSDRDRMAPPAEGEVNLAEVPKQKKHGGLPCIHNQNDTGSRPSSSVRISSARRGRRQASAAPAVQPGQTAGSVPHSPDSPAPRDLAFALITTSAIFPRHTSAVGLFHLIDHQTVAAAPRCRR